MDRMIEKLAAIESQITDLRSRLEPLTPQSEQLNLKIAHCHEQLRELEGESLHVRTEVLAAATEIDTVLSALSELKKEGEQWSVQQEEDRHIRESMTSMFGEAFQVVSRFFDTAQKIGLLDKEKVDSFLGAGKDDLQDARPTVPNEAPPVETLQPTTEETDAEVVEPVVEPEESTPEAGTEVAESADETVESTAEESAAHDADPPDEIDVPPTSSPPGTEETPAALPPLPDVTSSVETLPPVDDVETEAETKTTSEIASELDLAPLQFDVPQVPQEESSGESADKTEDEIEALLTDMSKPIST